MAKLNSLYPVIGFSTNVFDNPAEVEGIVDKILLDFDAIEIEIEDDALERIAQASDKEYELLCDTLKKKLLGLNHVSVHAPYLKKDTNLAAEDEGERALAIQKHELAIRFCHDINARFLTFHPGFNKPNKEVAMRQLLKSLDELVPYADKYNVALCLENMGNDRPKYLVFNAEEHIELHRDKGIYVTLDLVHLATWGLSYEELMDRIKVYTPITRVVHFNDMPENKHRHVPLGEGVLPMKAMLAQMKKCGYEGAAIVDEFSRPTSAEKYIEMTKTFVKELKSESGYVS
ncbi:MAG: hypothetical protein COV52_04410 [Gammaproteobacteria bacterium CG11_big_fil_rev_8_21_14_0_20_46_22]|nr:MAG: hypothetical protein COV52_04410 [Gammaproteobacteria bacterium CG11_big_fil_rev_8_21_14_0_20_46_22]